MSPMLDHYGCIYADPPWRFQTYSRKGLGRSAEAHYDCLSLEEIRRLPVAEWAAPDCVLLMWTTDPMLPQALDVIKAWQFTYKTTGFVWAKTGRPSKFSSTKILESFPIGTGYWTRANPEICLLATRGKPKRLSRAVHKLIVAPRREHSRKPDEAYERIEALCAGPYLEMFSRFDRPGWDSWGLEDGIGARRWRSDMREVPAPGTLASIAKPGDIIA